MAEAFLSVEERKRLERSFLGKTVRIGIDRPIGYVHHKEKYDLIYPINYGYIPDIIGGDGEEMTPALIRRMENNGENAARAIALYEKHGFVEVGRRRGYYEKPKEDAILMTLFFEETEAIDENTSI